MTRYVLPALRAGDPFPPAERALPPGSPAPGLLAVGGALDVPTLRAAYAGGIFPWYDQSAGENIMWWSTDPRMVLRPANFRLHRSLRRAIAPSSSACARVIESGFSHITSKPASSAAFAIS